MMQSSILTAILCTEKIEKISGGGLILYIKSTIRAGINEELTKCEFEESLWCNVELEHQRLLVGLCYRCPTSIGVNDDKLLHMMEKAVLQTRTHHVLVMGDFNYPEIDYKWEVVAAGDTDPPTLFFNKTQELCRFQHISDATRVRQNQTPTILHYVFTDQGNLIDSVVYKAPLGKSDHMVLRWELSLATLQLKSLKFFLILIIMKMTIIVSSRDVRNRFKFRFGFSSVLEKNSDSVRNEFGSVRFAKTRFGSDSYLLLM